MGQRFDGGHGNLPVGGHRKSPPAATGSPHGWASDLPTICYRDVTSSVKRPVQTTIPSSARWRASPRRVSRPAGALPPAAPRAGRGDGPPADDAPPPPPLDGLVRRAGPHPRREPLLM